MTAEAILPLDHSVHCYNLTHPVIPHLKSLYLEKISQNKTYDFLRVLLSLSLRGAIGSSVRRAAIAWSRK